MSLAMREPVHRSTCRVLYGDTDAAGVVYYGNYLRYFELGRTEYMRDLVQTYREIESQGLVLPVIECYTRYKAPAAFMKSRLFMVEPSCILTCHLTPERFLHGFHLPQQNRMHFLLKRFMLLFINQIVHLVRIDKIVYQHVAGFFVGVAGIGISLRTNAAPAILSFGIADGQINRLAIGTRGLAEYM